MLSDGELLRRYADDGAEDAFRELVDRHIHGVYRAALRRVGGNAHAADDVTQRVFTDLARKAKKLRDRPNLAGWLYTGTRFAAAVVVRAEQRRRTHEQEAHTMHEINAPEPVPSLALAPVLDDILDALGPDDRDVVVLHFLEGLTFAEVGQALSLTGDAARMRVNRALDRLRSELGKRGIASTATALGTVLSAQVGISAPASLVGAVAGRALAAAAGPVAVSTGLLGPILGTVGVGAAALATYLWQPWQNPAPSTPTTPPAAVSANVQRAVVTVAEAVDAFFEAVGEAFSPPPTGLPVTVPSSFASLTGAEQDVLKKLARIRADRGDAGWGFSIGEPGASYAVFVAGRDGLVARGLAKVNPKGAVFLEEAGRAFLDSHEAEVAAHLDFWPAERIALGQARDFSELLVLEKNILKRIWTAEAGAQRAVGLMVAEEHPGRTMLLERGWVSVGPQGGVRLTPAGRAFTTANQQAIEAYVIPTPNP